MVCTQPLCACTCRSTKLDVNRGVWQHIGIQNKLIIQEDTHGSPKGALKTPKFTSLQTCLWEKTCSIFVACFSFCFMLFKIGFSAFHYFYKLSNVSGLSKELHDSTRIDFGLGDHKTSEDMASSLYEFLNVTTEPQNLQVCPWLSQHTFLIFGLPNPKSTPQNVK